MFIENGLAGRFKDAALFMALPGLSLAQVSPEISRLRGIIIMGVNDSYSRLCFAVPVRQFAKEDKKISYRVFRSVDCLDNINKARHTSNFIENDPVTDNS